MSADPLSQAQADVLAALAGRGQTWSTLDHLAAWRPAPGHPRPLDGYTPRAVALAAIDLAKLGYASRIKARHQVQYKITATGRAVHDDSRKTGPPPSVSVAEVTASEAVSSIYDLSTAVPVLCVGITTRGRLLWGTRDGKGWAHRPEWQGILNASPSQLQDTLEQVRADQHHIERSVYPAPLRKLIRAALADCPRTSTRVRDWVTARSDRWNLSDVMLELRDMAADGEVTRPGRPELCWVLTVRANNLMADQGTVDTKTASR